MDASGGEVQSPETYAGYRRSERFASPERLAQDSRKTYSPPATLYLNQWGLIGPWNIGAESAVLQAAPGKIVFRFHARDLHMVLGPTKNGKSVRFKVKLNGAAPGDNRGLDSAPDGTGEVRGPRLYQLIRQKGQIEDRTFEIEFLDPGVQAFSFTFGEGNWRNGIWPVESAQNQRDLDDFAMKSCRDARTSLAGREN